MFQRGMSIFMVLLAGFFVIHSAFFLIVGPSDWDPTGLERATFGVVPIAAAGSILWGLRLGERAPWLGAGLLIGGTLAMALLWYWLFVISLPLLLLVSWFAVSRARRSERERRALDSRA